METKGILNFCLRRTAEGTVILLLILFMPKLPPDASFSESFSINSFKPFEGPLSLNEKLNEVEIWHKGDFIGPEAFADYNGELYTTLLRGDVVKLINNDLIPVARFGKPCKGLYDERTCGRPLGLTFDKNGSLFVADAYYGLYNVNVQTGKKERLVSPEQEIGGKKSKVFNSVAVASNGDIYWTDSSTEFYLDDLVYDLLADPSGRLIHYNAKTQQNTVLIDKLSFANGVALAQTEEFVIVAETMRNRIHRYYLKGPKKGTRDIFIDKLPGVPDNLNTDGVGGFFVPLVVPEDKEHLSLIHIFGPYPMIRKFIARLMGLGELVVQGIDALYPSDYAKKVLHAIGHCTSINGLLHKHRSTILRVDNNGEIIDSLHNQNGRISSICDVHIFQDTLYLGSPFNDYIARIPLAKVGWSNLAKKTTAQPQPMVSSQTTKTPPVDRKSSPHKHSEL